MGDRKDGQSKFANWLRGHMRQRDIKGPRQLGAYTGISHSTISEWLRGKSLPSEEKCYVLAGYFRVNPESILVVRREDLYARLAPTGPFVSEVVGAVPIPVTDQEAGAGKGVLVPDYELIEPTITTRHRNAIAVRVRGDSMSPRIDSGDVIIVDRDRDWENGQIVLAQIDDVLMVKRAYREDERVRLRSENEYYEDVWVTDVAILGLAIRVIKPL